MARHSTSISMSELKPYEKILMLKDATWKMIKRKKFPNDASFLRVKEWMDTPNPRLCGVTPNIFIEQGHGVRLINMLVDW